MSDPWPVAPTVPPPPPAAPTPVAPEPPRRRTGVIVGAIAIVVALVAGAAAFVLTRGEGSAEAQPLALAFTEGQSETYAIHMSMDGTVTADMLGGEMPMTMDMSEVVGWRVVSVDDKGLATIEMEISELTGTLNGIAMPESQTAMPPVEIVVAPDGRVVSAGGLALGGAGQTQGFGFPGMDQITPLLPDDGRAVAPGDTWTKDFSQDFPFGKGTIEFTTSSTYDRNETVDGRGAAVIVTHLTVPLDFTMSFQDLIDSMGEGFGATGATGIAELADASIDYSGSGDVTQTSFVDLAAKQLLRSESTGRFDISMEYRGIPQLQGSIGFEGTFTQELERR